ncbi:hypothetical protein HK104_010678 [Borealophlyctis nickersoniae]|nr:hypothetical protein HK104_010678 [Borealophlyctis nickersoniae]
MPSIDTDVKHILILDDAGTPSVYRRVNYTDFVSRDENVRLLIITSEGALSDTDKVICLAYVELKSPTTNGMVEVWAKKFHDEHRIDQIYTKQEDLILRASHLRAYLGVKDGLLPHQAIVFRDKEEMKHTLQLAGFPVPPFRRVHSPSDVLAFADTYGYPIVLKPTLGSASAGVGVIRNASECELYLEHRFFECINDKVQDMSGDIIVEAFVDGSMFHVNGYARRGELVYVWPFAYVSTNLEFTAGKAYGNVLVPKGDPLWDGLVKATQRVLAALPQPENLMFHLELFGKRGVDGGLQEHMLCEIAARRPGGSIGLLIDMAEGGGNIFPEMEFRLNNGLPLRHDREAVARVNNPGFSCGDLMVPLRVGRLAALPAEGDVCPVAGVQYIPIAKVGQIYKGFNINAMNTCARFVVTAGEAGVDTAEMQRRLGQALEWFDARVVYEPVTDI